MRRYHFLKKSEAGFSLVEALLAIALFGLLATVFAGAVWYGQETAVIAGQETRAALLAEERLAAVRSIRDEQFSNLSDGTFGLAVQDGVWSFSGSSDSTGTFTRTVTITSLDASTKEVTAEVTWAYSPERTGNVSVTSRLANWKGE